MVRVCLMMFAAMVAVAAATNNLPCPPRKENVRCRNFCKDNTSGSVGEYYCCDEDSSSNNNLGSCPRTGIQGYERDLMCDRTDPNRPYSLNCKRDSDCHAFEKCCYLPNNQRICRFAVYD